MYFNNNLHSPLIKSHSLSRDWIKFHFHWYYQISVLLRILSKLQHCPHVGCNAFLLTNELILLTQQDPRFIAKITGPNNKKWNWNADHTMFPVYITRNLLQNKPINLKLKSGTCTSNGPFSHSGVRNAVLVYDTETFTRVPRISRQSTNRLQILGVRMVTRIKLHSADPQLCSDLWTPLSSGAFCSLYVEW